MILEESRKLLRACTYSFTLYFNTLAVLIFVFLILEESRKLLGACIYSFTLYFDTLAVLSHIVVFYIYI